MKIRWGWVWIALVLFLFATIPVTMSGLAHTLFTGAQNILGDLKNAFNLH